MSATRYVTFEGRRCLSQVDAAAESIASDRITPVFAVSNVTGQGLPLLRAFVARLRRNKAKDDDTAIQVRYNVALFSREGGEKGR